MAQITVTQLFSLVNGFKDWKAVGSSPPDFSLSIHLPGKSKTRQTTVVHPDLADMTLSFEGHGVALNLDFDDDGYLIAIEFV